MSPDPDTLAALGAQVTAALAEDVGDGDLTAALVPEDATAPASLRCRQHAVLCGRAWAEEVYAQLGGSVRIAWEAQDGTALVPDQVVCRIEGPARTLLTGERCALNFLQTLSATATRTREYVQAVEGTGARILDTRKTLPGLRLAQKYAVRCGGGENHRRGLYDGILIKENHIAAAGGVAQAVRDALRIAAPGVMVEVEVENLEQLDEALAAGARLILLDNFGLDALRAAVARTRGCARLEASGGVDLASVRAIAETGVDFISVGALTKHVQAVDLSLRMD